MIIEIGAMGVIDKLDTYFFLYKQVIGKDISWGGTRKTNTDDMIPYAGFKEKTKTKYKILASSYLCRNMNIDEMDFIFLLPRIPKVFFVSLISSVLF